MTLDHEALRELAVAYAFETLDAAERREFEAHLRTCAECQQDVRDAVRLAVGMGQVVDATPSPLLRDRVLSAATRPAKFRDPRDASVPSAPARVAGAPRWLAIAASIVALAAAAGAWTEYRRSTAALADAARARQQVAEVQGTLARVQADAAETERVLSIVTAADVRRIELAGQPSAPQATGRVFWSESRGLFLTATSLPALPRGRIYQLWYVTAGAPVSAALVSPDASGGVSLMSGPAAPVRPKAFALTVEPAGGVPAPTGAMYLLGAL
jgi:anti-sigma-K factor RskA